MVQGSVPGPVFSRKVETDQTTDPAERSDRRAGDGRAADAFRETRTNMDHFSRSTEVRGSEQVMQYFPKRQASVNRPWELCECL